MRNTQAWCTHVRLGYKVSILRPGARAQGVRVVKLAGQDRYLARSRTYQAGSYFSLEELSTHDQHGVQQVQRGGLAGARLPMNRRLPMTSAYAR